MKRKLSVSASCSIISIIWFSRCHRSCNGRNNTPTVVLAVTVVLSMTVLTFFSVCRRRGWSVCPFAAFSTVWVISVVKSAPCCSETFASSPTPPPHWRTCGSGIRTCVTWPPLTGRRRRRCCSWAMRHCLDTLPSSSAPTAASFLQTAAWTWATCSSAPDRPHSSGFPTMDRVYMWRQMLESSIQTGWTSQEEVGSEILSNLTP